MVPILLCIIFSLLVLLALIGFWRGYLMGLNPKGDRPQLDRPQLKTAIFGLILLIVPLIVGTFLAMKFGEIARKFCMALGFSLTSAFIAGYGAGSRKRKELSPYGTFTIILSIMSVMWMVYIGTQTMDMSFVASQLGIGSSVGSRKDAPNTSLDCRASLNEIYKGFQHFSDTNGSLPPAEKWMDQEDFKGAVQADEWLHCPSVSNRKDDNFGYALNPDIAGKGLEGKKLNEIPNAAKTPLVYDTTDLAKNAHGALSTLPKPGRHHGLNNILYCDGHIEEVAPK